MLGVLFIPLSGLFFWIKKKIKGDIRGYYTFKAEKFNNSLVEIKGQKHKPTIKIYNLDSTNLVTSLNENIITINDKEGDFKALGYIENDKVSGDFLYKLIAFWGSVKDRYFQKVSYHKLGLSESGFNMAVLFSISFQILFT